MRKRTSLFSLSLALLLWHCFSLWPSLPSCQHPSTLLTLIVIGVTPLFSSSVIDFIRVPFHIKTRSPRPFSLLSTHPSHRDVIRDTQWNVPVATRQDITSKIKGDGSRHCQSGTAGGQKAGCATIKQIYIICPSACYMRDCISLVWFNLLKRNYLYICYCCKHQKNQVKCMVNGL